MNLNQLRIALFITLAVASSPAMLAAQSDPMASPASSTQPNRPNQQQAATTSMQDSTGNSGMTPQMMQDKMFLRKAAQGGMAEVQLGQLAAQKASSDDVKAFGQKMVTDHAALNEKMKPIADSMGVMLPRHLNKMDQAEYDKLNGLSGNDFDTEYLTFMVKDHHKDLREFREEAANTTDETLKAAVISGEKVIKEHSVMVDQMAKDKGISMPSHKSATAPPQ